MKPAKTNHIGRSRLPAVIAAITVFLISGWGYAAPEDEKNNREKAESCVHVDLAKVETRSLEEVIRAIGTIKAFQNVVVHPETNGIVDSVHFKEGENVGKGDLLFTIDDAKIRAELKARQAALEEAEANRENAYLVYQRRQKLYKQDLGTQEARDEARTRYQALTAQVKRIKAEIENIQETLDDTRIRAPFDGIAGEQLVDPGQLVSTETALTSIVEIDRLKLSFTVPERYMGRVRTGQEIRVSVDAYPDKKFSGKVYFLDPQIEPSTRSLKLKARMENPDNLLRPGGFATIELITGINENVPVIPEEALIPTRKGYMVFEVRHSKAMGRDVKIGLRKPGMVEITQGLQGGETIVQAGHISLDEGDRICSE
ncbi:MAG: efflux RND transporter periplasmic adaptor subunit [Desulfobacteraceae bacterium]|nr:efflux RND transporter periplasmic adaptor subunit [Desulfobacteraceae bacterium]